MVLGLLLVCVSSSAAGPSIAILDYEKEAESFSTFSVRVRITNDGSVPLPECATSLPDRPEAAPCVAIAYRGDRRPPRVTFSRLDRAVFLPGVIPIPAGATIDTSVQITTPRRAKNYVVYLYLVSGDGSGDLVWKENILPVKVGKPPGEIARNIRRTRLLSALYLVGTSVAVGSVVMARRRRTSG
jgi:hypothetical protein